MQPCAHPRRTMEGPGLRCVRSTPTPGAGPSFREVRGTGKGAVFIRLETDVAGCRSSDATSGFSARHWSRKKKIDARGHPLFGFVAVLMVRQAHHEDVVQILILSLSKDEEQQAGSGLNREEQLCCATSNL